VSVVLNLFNQRDWNANQFSTTASTPNAGAEFDLGVDLAYVTLKEAFYAPLTLTLGRQDIEFGRGLVIGNWNIQDPQAGIIADEFSAVTSFDAARATLDFEPWTLDFVFMALDENDVNDDDDRNVFVTNVNYAFSEYNAEWEAYAVIDEDGSTADNAVSTTVESKNRTYAIGTRAQFDPVSNMTLGGEIAYQGGNSQASAVAQSQEREAWLFDIFGEYRWADHAYKPYVGLEYVYLSGDDTTTLTENEGWNGLFRSPTYGTIHEYLETYYATALNGDGAAGSNRNIFFVSGGFAPMEDLKIDAKYYWFWTDEDLVSTINATQTQRVGDDLGSEIDVNITYDYTEDVTFSLGLAWFFPGDVYGDAVSSSVAGSNDQGRFDDTASQAVAGVNVAF